MYGSPFHITRKVFDIQGREGKGRERNGMKG